MSAPIEPVDDDADDDEETTDEVSDPPQPWPEPEPDFEEEDLDDLDDDDDEPKTSHFGTIEVAESGSTQGPDGLPIAMFRAEVLLADGSSIAGFGVSSTQAVIAAAQSLIMHLKLDVEEDSE